MNQKIVLAFSTHGVQQPLNVLIREVREVISEAQSTSTSVDPYSLIGCHILHKFIDRGKDRWYNGYVLDYDGQTHSIMYDEDGDEVFKFNLTEDLSLGDLKVL